MIESQFATISYARLTFDGSQRITTTCSIWLSKVHTQLIYFFFIELFIL